MYLEIDEHFHTHRKTLGLCSLMNDTNAGMHLVRLWSWAVRVCPAGDLTGLSPADVERAAGYYAADGQLFEALIAIGFVDVDREKKTAKLHGWKERTGRAVKRLRDGAKRMKAWRKSRSTGKASEKTELAVAGDDSTSRVTNANALSSECVQSEVVIVKGIVKDKKKKKQPAAVASAGNVFENALGSFSSRWQAVYGTPYQPTPADKAQLGRLLGSSTPATLELLPELFSRYLEDRDPFVAEKRRHDLAYFCTSGGVNKYAAASRAPASQYQTLTARAV
jgi:hypothetical protein